MKVLVCGGRDFSDSAWVFRVLDSLNPDHIIEGGATGADAFAQAWAIHRCKTLSTVQADWKRHGRAAGAIRNQEMIDRFNPDLVIAFPGGKGTADMIRRARKAGIEVMEMANTTLFQYAARASERSLSPLLVDDDGHGANR